MFQIVTWTKQTLIIHQCTTYIFKDISKPLVKTSTAILLEYLRHIAAYYDTLYRALQSVLERKPVCRMNADDTRHSTHLAMVTYA